MQVGASAGEADRERRAQAPRSFDALDTPTRLDDDLTVGVLALVAALAAATAGQGAFGGPTRWVVAAGLTVALASSVRRRRTATIPITSVVIAAIGLACWIAVRGLTTDSWTGGTMQLGLIAAMAVAVLVCRRATPAERDALVISVIAMGVLVAVSGWIGLAFRAEPWANPGPTTWRASSTLTYPNAAAAVIVVALMVCIARRSQQPSSRVDSVVCCVLFAGLLATQSRGGAVALLVGLVALLVLGGARNLLRAAVVPAIGGGLAFLVAVPGFDATGPARPGLALAGLVVGASVAVALPRLTDRSAAIGASVVVASSAVVVVILRGAAGLAASDRLRLGSDDRVATMRETIEVIGDSPILGVGPGNLHLVWLSGDRLVSTGLAHNEYLQSTAELGMVGAVALTLLAATAIRLLVAARRAGTGATWIGGVAALSALAVHSGLDFLWHIPVVPLLAAVVFGVATCGTERHPAYPSPHPTGRDSTVDPQEGHHP